MDIAIVTGAENPLGLRIVQTLLRQGYRVYGIGNNFAKITFSDPQFRATAIDLTQLESVAKCLTEILDEEQRLHLLVHAIDVTPGTAFDRLPVGNLEALLKIGLLGPVMMTRLALPNLLRFRGQLINVIAGNKTGYPASAANALIEGGLREMNKALFDQCRDSGLRVTNCVLRQNTALAESHTSDAVLAQSLIHLEDLSRTVEQLIDPKAINIPSEIILLPRLSSGAKEALPETPLPLDPYAAVVLPPKQYCPPAQPKIPTEKPRQIERSIPYTDEELEDKIAAAIEDYEANPDRYEQPDPMPRKAPREVPQQQNGPQSIKQEPDAPRQESQSKRRRRRRGGRNRSKERPAQGFSPSNPHEKTTTDVPTTAPEQKESARPGSESKTTPRMEVSPAQAKPAKKTITIVAQPPARSESQATAMKEAEAKAAKKKTATKKIVVAQTADKQNAKKAVKKAAKKTVQKAAKKTVKKTAKKVTKKVTKKAAKKAAKKTAKKAATKVATPSA